MTRRTPIGRARRVMGCVAAALVCVGCSGPILRPQSPEASLDLPPMPDVKYVSEYTHPYGMNYVKLEGSFAGDGPERAPAPTRRPQRSAPCSWRK